MIVERDYEGPDGRLWDLHRIRDWFSGDETWAAESLDESGDELRADTRAELLRMLEEGGTDA